MLGRFRRDARRGVIGGVDNLAPIGGGRAAITPQSRCQECESLEESCITVPVSVRAGFSVWMIFLPARRGQSRAQPVPVRCGPGAYRAALRESRCYLSFAYLQSKGVGAPAEGPRRGRRAAVLTAASTTKQPTWRWRRSSNHASHPETDICRDGRWCCWRRGPRAKSISRPCQPSVVPSN
jgi:hypothetical protein